MFIQNSVFTSTKTVHVHVLLKSFMNINLVNIALYEIYLTTKFSQCGNNTVCITYQHITFNMVSSADHCSPNVNCKVKLIPVTVRMLIFRYFEYHISSHL